MHSLNGIMYMTVPETEIDIEKFTHIHSEGSLVFGKYKGSNIVVDRRKQLFCHFATCRTFSCYGNDDYVYHRWGCVEKEEQYEFYDYRINGQVNKKHTFTKGTCFKVLHLGFYIQIYAQFPTYGYLGSEMCNTNETSDRHQQVPLPTGYKPINDSEINIDKFKLTTIVNDMVFGIYNNEHVSIDRHYAVFCSFVDVSTIEYPAAFAHKFGKWYKVKQTGDFVVTADQQHWLFSKNATVPKGSVVKFDRKESGTGYIMKIQVSYRGLAYFGTELFNKIEPVKEEPVTKEQTKSPSFTLSDMLTQSNIGDVVGVYDPNETTVFVKTKEPALLNSYICDANGNKWVLSNRNLKPINRNDVSPKQMERILSKEEAIQADKESTTLLGTKPFDSLLDLANVMSAESLFKRICKQVGLEYPDVPTEAFIRMAFGMLPDYTSLAQKHNSFINEADIKFVNGDKYDLFSKLETGSIYKKFTPAKQETKPTEQTANKMSTAAKQDYFKAALKADEQYSIDSNTKYAKFDYEKGLLLNSNLIKDETFKEYNEPVEPFSINLFDKLTTYVPVISPVWYKDFARAGFCNTDDVNSFVNMDANGNPWFIIKTPKVVKPIEKEPLYVKQRVLETVNDLVDNTVLAKFALITNTNKVYQTLSELEYKQYTQSQFAKGNPVVESIRDKADQIWVKISM